MDELAGDRVHPGREFGGRHHPPMAFLVVAKVLPAMQERAAQVEPLGVEGGLDLPPLRLPDQPLGRDAGRETAPRPELRYAAEVDCRFGVILRQALVADWQRRSVTMSDIAGMLERAE